MRMIERITGRAPMRLPALLGSAALIAAVAAFGVATSDEQAAPSLTGALLNHAMGANAAYSPASAVIALGLTAEGASEDLRKGLPATLRPDAWTFPIADAKIANAVWVAEGIDLEEAFKDAADTHWQAGVTGIDPASGAGVINAWAKEKTEGKIEKLVDALPDDIAVVLTNAIYFKAPWAVPFKEDGTEPGAFTRADGTEMQVPYMRSGQPVRTGEIDGARLVSLPFKGGETAMLIVMPPEGAPEQAADAAAALLDDPDALNAALTDQKMLRLPRFAVTGGGDLTDLLAGAGFADLIAAPLTGIAREAPKITAIVQRAVVEIDEAGAEAAAATAVMMVRTSVDTDHPVITIDRPFFFAIVNEKAPVPLFAGYVAEPEDADASE